jgi:hypothetical protein
VDAHDLGEASSVAGGAGGKVESCLVESHHGAVRVDERP